ALAQMGNANLNPWTESKVDTKNPDRGPLLIIDGENDHTVPWAIANAAYKRQKRNPGVTEIVKMPNRGHALTIDHAWRELAAPALVSVHRLPSLDATVRSLCPRSRPQRPDRLMKPRVFLGSSGQQEKLLQALPRGLQDIADVAPWTTVFNPGLSTLDRLVELTHEVDFAAFVFAQDDWTTKGASPGAASGQASPRDNVVYEAGLFGGALGIRRTFILHANG